MRKTLDKINRKIHAKKLDGGVGVIAPDEPHELDFHIGFWGIGKDYRPKHTRVLLKPVSQKNQTGRNTCCYESAVGAKEIDERKELSVRSAVAWAKTQGFISGDGFSSLKASQDTLRKFGAAKNSLVDDSHQSWSYYSTPKTLTDSVVASAGRHKTKTYWKVSRLSELYELLDKDRPVQTAMAWYTGYNMGGGLRAPWILPYRRGYRVGAHAVYIIGYDRNYCGQDVIIFQNSYGENWGDKNKFYMRVSDFQKEFSVFAGYTNLDQEKDYGEFLRNYSGHDVKSDESPKVYRIENGKKRHYVDPAAYGRYRIDDMYHIVDHELLTQVPEGKPITLP